MLTSEMRCCQELKGWDIMQYRSWQSKNTLIMQALGIHNFTWFISLHCFCFFFIHLELLHPNALYIQKQLDPLHFFSGHTSMLSFSYSICLLYMFTFRYHVTNFFAPSSRFGTPEDLKSLIDKAHELGLLVLMDIVHRYVCLVL